MRSLMLDDEEMKELNLLACGRNVQISSQALLINPNKIRIGSHVRIDAFCILSAGSEGIDIGDYVHIAAGASIYGAGGRVNLHAFTDLSGRASVYTASDDFRHGHLVGPTVPNEFRQITKGDVTFCKFAVVGCGSVILPGVTLGEGASVGALTVVRKSINSAQIVNGNPARSIGSRNLQRLMSMEQRLQELEGRVAVSFE